MKANEWMIDTDGSVYYFRSWGGAYLNCKARINGRSYTFGADSKVQGSQWVVKGGKWYLVKDGKIATGWQTWDGNKYYMNSDGSMRSNEWRLDDTGKSAISAAGVEPIKAGLQRSMDVRIPSIVLQK